MSCRMSAARIISCSKEHFRMYNAMCKTEEDKKSKTVKVFATRTPAIFLAAAIGISDNESKEVDKDRQLTRREYLVGNENYHVFESILKSKDGLKTEQEIIDRLMEHAAYGIEVVYNEERWRLLRSLRSEAIELIQPLVAHHIKSLVYGSIEIPVG